VVRVNDRGPITPGRVIDLSYKAAEILQFNRKGIEKVRIDLVEQQAPVLTARNLST
jgi:rare lipoprotein A